MKALIVDDSEPFLERIKRHLSQEADIEIVGEARNGFEAVAEIERLQPEVVLLDLNMPKSDGFEVLREVTERFQDTRVVVLTIDASAVVRQRCTNLRAHAVVGKADAAAEVVPALREAMRNAARSTSS